MNVRSLLLCYEQRTDIQVDLLVPLLQLLELHIARIVLCRLGTNLRLQCAQLALVFLLRIHKTHRCKIVKMRCFEMNEKLKAQKHMSTYEQKPKSEKQSMFH